MVKTPMELTVDGLTLSLSNWQDRTGIPHRVIRWRISLGWTPEQCVGREDRPPVDHRQDSSQGQRVKHSRLVGNHWNFTPNDLRQVYQQ